MSTERQSYCEGFRRTFSYGSASIASNYSYYTSSSQEDLQLRSSSNANIKQTGKNARSWHMGDTGRCIRISTSSTPPSNQSSECMSR
ncbi:hypothetical protein CDAR_581791 [Caerostris darwini]|uniref:Uncharacterized protein n=1 Tax=Caerostris darwini TaxID=1538125 RepID=A0AAV4X4T4_9ARAC|nr:hypothetical protein CDAR_581791 [Caerostris darwini]